MYLGFDSVPFEAETNFRQVPAFEPSCPHLYNAHKKSFSLMRLLGGLGEIILGSAPRCADLTTVATLGIAE